MSEYKLEIITPEKQFFNGEVEAVACHTPGGDIGVMRGHQPMTAALSAGEMQITSGGKKRGVYLSDAFMEVRPDEVVIFAKSCEWSEDVDVASAERERALNKEKLRHESSIAEHKHGKISLARTMAQIKTKKEIK